MATVETIVVSAEREWLMNKRYVDIDKFKEQVQKAINSYYADLPNGYYLAEDVIEDINCGNFDLADVDEVRRGKWIDVPDYGGNGWQIAGKPVQPKQCSVCGDVYSKAYNYCPWCGTKMNKE